MTGVKFQSMMRSAIVVLAFATALPACAQRAGGHAGFALRSGPAAHAFRNGIAPARPLIRSSGSYAALPRPQFPQRPLRYVTIAPAGASRFYQRNNTNRTARRPRGFAMAYPIGVIGFPPDTGFYDDSFNEPPYPSEPTALQPDYGYNEYPPNYPDYGAQYAQYPQPGEPAPVTQVPSTAATAETVTLIFNNGQPPEQIQNYLATRTTLMVIDGTRRREIPIAELDVPATVKANRAAGIDFSLPTATP
jgi:hypothetical protein